MVEMAKSKKKADEQETGSSEPSAAKSFLQKLRDAHPEATVRQEATEVVRTGSFSLDRATGIGGFPYGRVVELYGAESCGKSTLMLSTCVEVQKQGHSCLYIDYEHALDVAYAVNLGVDMSEDKFIWVQPKTLEEGADIAYEAVTAKAVRCVVVDSIAAAVPKAELEGESGDSHMGLQARLVGQFLKRITGPLALNKALMLVVNQTRLKIGVMFGSPVTTPCGQALKFYSSIRLDMGKSTLKLNETVYGIRSRVKVAKNKMSLFGKECEFNITYGKGIDQANEVLTIALELGTIVRAGAWFSIADNQQKIGQGEVNAANWLRDNPATWSKLLKEEEE